MNTNDSPRNFHWLKQGQLAGSGMPHRPNQAEWLKDQGITDVVYLNMEGPLHPSMFKNKGVYYHFEPIPDYHPPTLSQAMRIVKFISESLAEGKVINVCCRSGIGRTPTVLSMFLVYQGSPPDEAISLVAKSREGWGHGTLQQRRAVFKFAQRINP